LAGATAASKLGQEFRTVLVDPRPSFPSVFKAEKFEPEQAELLRKLGLLETFLPNASRIREVQSYYAGRFFKVTETEQYGIRYGDMVNTLRSTLPAKAFFKLGRVVEISNSPDLQVLTLNSGEQLICRLVVLACGLNDNLLRGLQMKRTWVQKPQSAALGFTLVPAKGGSFPLDAVTYSLMNPRTGVDYVSLFPLGEMLRANLFAFPPAESSWMQRVVRDPNRELPHLLPKLSKAIGEYRVEGKIESSITNLYRTDGDSPDGVVLIGDASENSCPATGTGLTKIFTDVDILSELMPNWFASSGMSHQKLRQFLDDPRKVSADSSALRAARYRRNACSQQSIKWRVHRLRLHLSRQLRKV
jgi:2-polyprenyl-6-methoxyphenol hydroxylase-like FAD-dependent oxidoreductase